MTLEPVPTEEAAEYLDQHALEEEEGQNLLDGFFSGEEDLVDCILCFVTKKGSQQESQE